jgi:hypothetical protein
MKLPTLRLNVAPLFSGSGSPRRLLLLAVLRLPDNEDEGTTSLRNTGNSSPVDKAWRSQNTRNFIIIVGSILVLPSTVSIGVIAVNSGFKLSVTGTRRYSGVKLWS